MSKPWGIGAWAAEAEQAEEEERQQEAAAAAAALAAPAASFPSLKESVVGGANKKKQKNKMSLQQFQTAPVGRRDSPFEHKGLTPDEMLRLPTGPKERSADEMQYGRLGGGFPSYGRSGGMPDRNMRGGDRDGESSWGGGGGGGRRSYGGFEDDRRGPPPRASEFDGPSRADEADNWAMGKKQLPSQDSGRPNRYSALGGGGGAGGFSRADDVDNWGTGKKPLPGRSSSFGATFRDPGREREPEGDRWNRGGGFREMEPERERPRLVLNPPKEGGAAVVETVKTSNKSNPFGAARPREDVLAEKGLDWKKLDLDIEAKKSSRPTSSHSSRPSSAQSNRSESQALQGVEGLVVKPKPKVNPFGDAKPREVTLEQKGLDWRKMDLELEHRRVDRAETEAEKKLKEEIDHLKNELEKQSSSADVNRGSLDASGEDRLSLSDLIRSKEKDLEVLIRELDDKVRFGQRSLERPGSGGGRAPHFNDRPGSGGGRAPHFNDRPGSGAGRSPHYPDRLPSQSGATDDSRSVEFVDRPRSRGTGGGGDAWPRQFDDRKPFQGGRERGFLGGRGMDRSRSRERW